MHLAKTLPMLRRAVLALALLATGVVLTAEPADAAANPAEQFVTDNIHRGLDILANKQLTTVQRRDQFETFLLGVVDVRRIALFTLGQYRRTASPQDTDAFVAGFKNYAVATYQTYFSKYSGQTLRVTGSSERSPTDYIVVTQLIDPSDNNGQQPLEVDFRIRTDTGKPVLVDVAVAGIWVSLEEQAQFTAFLGQNDGNIRALIAHLSELAAGMSKK